MSLFILFLRGFEDIAFYNEPYWLVFELLYFNGYLCTIFISQVYLAYYLIQGHSMCFTRNRMEKIE